MLISLITLTVVYGALAVVEIWLLARFVRRGSRPGTAHPSPAPPPRAHRTTTCPAAGDQADDVLSFAY